MNPEDDKPAEDEQEYGDPVGLSKVVAHNCGGPPCAICEANAQKISDAAQEHGESMGDWKARYVEFCPLEKAELLKRARVAAANTIWAPPGEHVIPLFGYVDEQGNVNKDWATFLEIDPDHIIEQAKD